MPLCACGGGGDEAVWQLPNSDLEGTRAASGSAIDAGNVSRLEERWRFAFTAEPTFSGIFASTPVANADTVYAQDLRSNVFALDRSNGALRWARHYHARNDGPNGLAVTSDGVYGATDSDAFRLDPDTGKERWRRHLRGRASSSSPSRRWCGRTSCSSSTLGFPPTGRGAIYALDAETGAVRWKFVTVKEPWTFPLEAGGGGAWNPVSVDSQGRLYAGNSNPGPWGGTPERPNGGIFPGPVLYTDSLLVLEARTGKLLWYDQVTPHDVRDYDFQATPVLATLDGVDVVFGREGGTGDRLGPRDAQAALDRGRRGAPERRRPLPPRRVTVCPGLLGGVETPMAYADGRLFVPVVDLCGWGSAIARQELTELDPMQGRGRLVALDGSTGRRLWERRLPSPNFGCATVSNDVVFTSTYAGTVYAFAVEDGELLWRGRLPAGLNACPAVVGDLLLVGAGVRLPETGGSSPKLVAFSPRSD